MAAYNYVTVTGSFPGQSGTVTFAPSEVLTDLTGAVTVAGPGTFTYTLSGGSFTSAPLLATDNLGLQPAWSYTVTVALAGQRAYSYPVLVPYAGGASQALSSLAMFPSGSSAILTGPDTSKPAASTVTTGANYIATDTGVSYYSDGATWQFAFSQADGVSAPTPAVFPGLTYLLAPSSATNAGVASGGLTVALDSSNYDWGSSSIKCTTDGAAGSNYYTITLGSPVNLSSACLALGVEIDSFTPYSDFQVRLSSDGFASGNYDYCQPLYTGASQRWIEPGLWEYITVNRGGVVGNMSSGQWKSSGTGLASYSSVTAIRFKLVDNGGSAPMTVRLGFLGYFQAPAQGVVSVTFDDSRATQYTVAKPVMDNNGIRATCYNIGYNVENAGSLGGAYFTQAQMKQMQVDSHWEMGAHAFTDATGVQAHTLGYDSLTSHDGEIDLLQLKTWLRQQQALGIDSFALPHGTWSLNTSGTAGANADVLSLMAKYFNTCATTLANTIETYPPANRLKLRRYVVQSTDTATTLMAMVNAAVTNKWWLILAFHNLVNPVVSSTDFLPAQFTSFIQQLAGSGAACLPVGEVWRNPPPAAWAAAAGTVTSVTAADTSVVVGGTAAAPTVATGTLDVIAADHAPAASWSNAGFKITSLANGTAAADAAAFGQIVNVQPADVALLWWTLDSGAGGTTLGALPTAGTVYLSEFFLRAVQTLNGLAYYVGSAGGTLTSGQCFAGVYDSTGTLRATTADQAANFGGTGLKTPSFTSAYTSAPAGRYYAAFMFNGTTGPSFKGASAPGSLYNVNLTGASLRCATSSSTGNTTSLPSSITLSSSSSSGALPIWAGGI